MSTSLEHKIQAGIAAFAELNALVGARVYDTQFLQTTTYPAIAVQQVSNPKLYKIDGRMPNSWHRMQFTIRAASGAIARQVELALFDFLDLFASPMGNLGLPLCPNYVVNVRSGLYPLTQPPLYDRVVDVMMLSNDTL